MIQSVRLIALTFVTAIGSILIPSQLTINYPINASESSPYDSGYDHGCDDAGRSESDKYINQPEKGPSFHTNEFMDGYYAGLNSCGGRGENNDRDNGENEEFQPDQRQGTTIEDLCNQFYTQLQLSQPCSEYVNGNDLKGPGAFFIVCNLIKLGVSTSGPLGALLLAVPCG